MAKKNEIIVKDIAIKTITKDGIDYICITDIARQKNVVDPNGVIANWMRNRNTIEFLGIWETIHNPSFNPLEFEGFRKEAGLNAFTLSPTRWIEATNAIGIISLRTDDTIGLTCFLEWDYGDSDGYGMDVKSLWAVIDKDGKFVRPFHVG